MAALVLLVLATIVGDCNANIARDGASSGLDFKAKFGNWSVDAETFVNDYQSKCKPYIRELSTCLESSQATNQTARDNAGHRYWQCTAEYSTTEWFKCQKYEEYTKAKLPFGQARFTEPLNLTLDDKCKYADPSPILYEHCGKENLKGITGSKCCNSTAKNDECDKRDHAFRQCAGFTLIQYLRCSEEFKGEASNNPPGNATETCVADNIRRYKWPVESFTIQLGFGSTCKSSKRILGLIAASNVIALASALLLNVTFIKYIFGKKDKWVELKQRDVRISFLRMIVTTGTQLSVPIVIGFILKAQGYGTDFMLWWQVFIWATRPRSAFLIGLLGLVHPMWMETALDEMVADLLFSLLGGAFATWTLIQYDKGVGTGGLNAYYLAGCGLLLFSTLCVLLTILQLFFSLKALFYALAGVFLAFWELIVRLINGYRKVRGIKERMEPTKTVSWEEMKGTYILLLTGGCFLFVGGWMIWTSIMIMAGRLYCPADLKAVAAVLFVYPIILNVVRGLISF